MFGQTIDRGANLVHDMIGMMSYCNIGLGGLGVNIFVWISLKYRLVIRVRQFYRYAPLKSPYHIDQSNQHFISLLSAHCLPYPPQVHVGNGVVVLLFGRQPNCGHMDKSQ